MNMTSRRCQGHFLLAVLLVLQQLVAQESENSKQNNSIQNTSLTQFQSLITSEASLLGYWPLERNLSSVKGNLTLRVGGKNPVYRAGPLEKMEGSLDLANGRYANVTQSGELDIPDLTFEMIFKPRYITSGVLFGLRSGNKTRFSLHYEHGSSKLVFWDGGGASTFTGDTEILSGHWYHIALTIEKGKADLWINGKRCTSSGNARLNVSAVGLPLLVGTSDEKAGSAERGEFLASHLAIYSKPLSPESTAARLHALGWTHKLKPNAPVGAPDTWESIEARVRAIKETYGVQVHYKYASKEDIAPVWRGAGAPVLIPLAQVERTLDDVEKFLSSVPKALTKNCLESIYLFGKLNSGGAAWGKTMSLLVNRPDPQTSATLFHEFSHLLQNAYPVDKKSWEAQLPEGFKYGMAKGNPFHFDEKLRADGFIIQYSMTNMHEEFAVLSDYVLVRKEETKDLMESYPAIKRKVELLIGYYKSIGPEYDFSFYNDVLQPSPKSGPNN